MPAPSEELSPATVPDAPCDPDRRRILGGLAGLAGTPLLCPTAALAATAPPQPRRGGRIKVACSTSSTADTLDPAKGSNAADYSRAFMFYSGLTVLDTRLQAQPALATEWHSADAQTWRLKLRRGVRFHDGQPLRTADIVHSLMRHQLPASGSKVRSLAMSFDAVRGRGPDELEITLKSPNADLPVMLADAHFLIVREGTQDFRSANGTGPFRCAEFRPGERSRAVRNEGYWKDGPWLDEVELFGIADEGARLNALLSGDVQLINGVDPRSARRLKGMRSHVLKETRTGGYTDLIVRRDLAPGRSLDFVLGMKHLIDREQLRKAVFRGYAVVGNDHPFDPSHRYFDPGLPQRPYDPDKARYHLRRAGMLGARVPLVTGPPAVNSVDMGLLMQQTALQAGLELELRRMPADGYWSNHWMRHPLSFGNINARTSIDALLTQFFRSDAPWNESAWRHPRCDQLIDAARGETNEARRKQMYADVQHLIHHECGIGIPLFISVLEAHDRRLHGLGSVPTGSLMGSMFAEHVWWEDAA